MRHGFAPDHERIVLVGFMAAGKTAVGRRLAARLGWDFIDFDVEIERREQRPLAAVVQAEGEDYLRQLEAQLTEEIIHGEGLVIAPGGGWITQPHLLDAIRRGTLSAWLIVSPEETVRRLRADPTDRPFKHDPDTLSRIAAMLEQREPLYRLADLSIPTDRRDPEVIAFEIKQTMRTRAA